METTCCSLPFIAATLLRRRAIWGWRADGRDRKRPLANNRPLMLFRLVSGWPIMVRTATGVLNHIMPRGCAGLGISWVHSAIRSAPKIPLRCKASTGRIHSTMKTELVKSRAGQLNRRDARSPFFPDLLLCFKAEPADSEPTTRGVVSASGARLAGWCSGAKSHCPDASAYLNTLGTGAPATEADARDSGH